MKHISLLLLLFICFSCGKDNDNEQVKTIFNVSINNNIQSIGYKGGVSEIQAEITTNNNWKITSDSKFMTLSYENIPVTPNQTQNIFVTIKVNIEENNEESDRLANIVFSCNDIEKTIAIKQDGKKKFLNVSTDVIRLDKNSQPINFKVNTNIEYNIISNSDWIKKQGNVEVYKSDENNSSSNREGKIIISSKDPNDNLYSEIKVIQKNSYGSRYSDSLALYSIREQLKDTYLPDGWSNKPITEWRYIKTELIDDEYRVVEISSDVEYAHDYFKFSLTDQFKYLTELRVIKLLFNKVKGEIFKYISMLSKLEEVDLHYNLSMSGNIDEVCKLTNLKSLNLLGYSQIAGNFPSEISNLQKLEYLNLSFTNLGGGLPASIGELKSLKTLELYKMPLSGNIPKEIGDMDELEYLTIRDTYIKGSIPKEIGNLSNLISFNFEDNSLSGEIPNEIGKLKKLQNIYLRSSGLSGNIPQSIENLIELQSLCLAYNSFDGTILDKVISLKNLDFLELSDNHFSGEIPKELSQLTKLNELRLGDNNFSGEIPSEIGTMPLEHIQINNNRFVGNLPSTFINNPKWFLWQPFNNIYPQQTGFGFSNSEL